MFSISSLNKHSTYMFESSMAEVLCMFGIFIPKCNKQPTGKTVKNLIVTDEAMGNSLS
jgi:hypothetical protein